MDLYDIALSIRKPCGSTKLLCCNGRYSFIGTLLKLEGKYSEAINNKYPNRISINKLLIGCGYDVAKVWKIEELYERSSRNGGYDQLGIYDERIAFNCEFRMNFYYHVREMYGIKQPSLLDFFKSLFRRKND